MLQNCKRVECLACILGEQAARIVSEESEEVCVMGDFMVKDKQKEIVIETKKTKSVDQENSQALFRIWTWVRSL